MSLGIALNPYANILYLFGSAMENLKNLCNLNANLLHPTKTMPR